MYEKNDENHDEENTSVDWIQNKDAHHHNKEVPVDLNDWPTKIRIAFFE